MLNLSFEMNPDQILAVGRSIQKKVKKYIPDASIIGFVHDLEFDVMDYENNVNTGTEHGFKGYTFKNWFDYSTFVIGPQNDITVFHNLASRSDKWGEFTVNSLSELAIFYDAVKFRFPYCEENHVNVFDDALVNRVYRNGNMNWHIGIPIGWEQIMREKEIRGRACGSIELLCKNGEYEITLWSYDAFRMRIMKGNDLSQLSQNMKEYISKNVK